MSQPATPAVQVTEDNSVSPFNLEKHQERVRLLTKSPAAPQYSTRPMFASEPSDPEKVYTCPPNMLNIYNPSVETGYSGLFFFLIYKVH